MVKHYWLITKPGIIAANLISVAAGCFLASGGRPGLDTVLPVTAGTVLVIACGCVLNNCIDRYVDRLMTRTRERALATGIISPEAAVAYAAVLGSGGMAVLLAAGKLLSVVIVGAGLVVYVVLYSLWLKPRSARAPLIGSLAGAAPPLAGYCAVRGRIDTEALILLLIFTLWQMPHFYAIAIYRRDDYAAARIPVLPVTRGIAAAKRHIIGYVMAFFAATVALGAGGYAGYGYLATAVASGLLWLSLAWAAYRAGDDRWWARRLFLCSVAVLCSLNLMMAMDCTVPPAGPGAPAYASRAGSP